MRSRRSAVGLFFQSLALTLALLLPMVAAVAFFSRQRQHQLDILQAAASQGGVPVEAGAQNVCTLLLAVQEDVPELMLLRVDAPARSITLCAVPSQTLVDAPAGQTTLADCYLAAGPARAAQLLGQTVGAAPQNYFAATPATYVALLPADLAITLDTAPLLTPSVRRALGLKEAELPLTPAQAQAFVQDVRAAGGAVPALRALLWTQFLRADSASLDGLAAAARAASARTLTDLDARDLHTLEQALAYLAGRPDLHIEYDLLPTQAAPGGEALTEAALARAASLLQG